MRIKKTTRPQKKKSSQKNNRSQNHSSGDGKIAGRAGVLHPFPKGNGQAALRLASARMEEAVNLTKAIGLNVVSAKTMALVRPVPATLLGKGAVELFQRQIVDEAMELIVIDHPLTPVKQRNLERAWNL